METYCKFFTWMDQNIIHKLIKIDNRKNYIYSIKEFITVYRISLRTISIVEKIKIKEKDRYIQRKRNIAIFSNIFFFFLTNRNIIHIHKFKLRSTKHESKHCYSTILFKTNSGTKCVSNERIRKFLDRER